MKMTGFDNDAYVKMQSEKISERIAKFGGKLYLEFGGKLFDDFHASRVLPGFKPDSKIVMLSKLKDKAEIVIAINSSDIEKNKVRADLGITYDMDVLRLIDAFHDYGLYVGSVVLTRFCSQPSVIAYQKKLEALGIKVYRHYRGLPFKHSLYRQRRGLWKERLHRDKPLPHRRNRTGAGQRQDGYLPLTALPRQQARNFLRLCKVRDFPYLESPA